MKKGILICFTIAFPIWLLTRWVPVLALIGAPVLAMLAGMGLALLWKDQTSLQSGLTFTSKKLLQWGVILLGFGLNLTTLGRVGLTSLPIILATITTSLVVAFLMQRILKIPKKTAILVGVGSSVCGGSAIAATAPVLDANQDEIAQSISVIFLFNVIAALIFPTLGQLLGLSNNGFGLFAGTAINDTSSVTAAASSWDSIHKTGGQVLAYATVVKLTRTLAIIPITLVLSLITLKKEHRLHPGFVKKTSPKKVFPVFILYFILASLITTLCTTLASGDTLLWFQNIFSWFKEISKFCIVMAMAAIGLGTNLGHLIRRGKKPIFLGLVCWIAIALVSLLLQHVMGLN